MTNHKCTVYYNVQMQGGVMSMDYMDRVLVSVYEFSTNNLFNAM